MSTTLTAKEAAARLGISVPTLYAYVSRGLIRSQTAGTTRRTRLYSAEDVDRLRNKKSSAAIQREPPRTRSTGARPSSIRRSPASKPARSTTAAKTRARWPKHARSKKWPA